MDSSININYCPAYNYIEPGCTRRTVPDRLINYGPVPFRILSPAGGECPRNNTPRHRKIAAADEGGPHHIILGSLAVACLIMTKGLFTIIPIAAGIGLSLLYSKNYKAIFNWRWLLALIFIIIFLFPSLYGYYLQFDLHPEKKVFGENNVSGVKFFLWTSQWGRFTNTGPIKGKGDLSFFIHTMIWAFLPLGIRCILCTIS